MKRGGNVNFEEHAIAAKCLKSSSPEDENREKKRVLCVIYGCHVMCIGLGSSDNQYYSNTKPSLPMLFNLHLKYNLNIGSFTFNNKLFVLGGAFDYLVDVGEDRYRPGFDRAPLDVYEVKLDSSSEEDPITPRDLLSVSTTILPLNDLKANPVVVTVGRKVFIFDTSFQDKMFYCAFEVLDLDIVPYCWRRLPNPCHVTSRRATVYFHLVVGSRLYLFIRDRVERVCYFDTEKGHWQEVDDFIRPLLWKNSPILSNGISGHLSGLDHPVTLSFFYIVGEKHLDYRKLFATLFTKSGKPLCFQEIFSHVFLDILPSDFLNLSAVVFHVGDGQSYAVISGECSEGYFLSISIFKLLVKGGVSADIPKGELDSDHLQIETKVKEFQFLDVEVHEKYIFRMSEECDPISAAFLF